MSKSRFQTFSADSRADQSGHRLASLRAWLAGHGADALLLPRADVFQGEYLPPSEDRLAWLTGFTGSAGFVIAMPDAAALFVDGRYTVQAREQVDPRCVDVVPLAEASPDMWLRTQAGHGLRLAYDPALFTTRGLKRFESAARECDLELVALSADPFAAIWHDRPAPPATPIVDHPVRFAGEGTKDKLTRLQAKLADEKLGALVVSDCTAVNWLFNIRAGDVPHLPILRAFALVPCEGRPTLFADPARLSAGLREKLARHCDITSPAVAPGDGRAELLASVTALASTGVRIRLDEDSAPAFLGPAIEMSGGEANLGADPIALMKAVKNATELAGAREAHARDAVAMARFLAWLDRETGRQALTEIDAVIALEKFRRETGALKDISFPTISAAGPNAALPHYRVTDRSNRAITPGLYLVDSGGQYRDGTTDITRTVAIGKTTPAMRGMFTRVLKGMIAVSRAVYPKGTSGAQLDTLARQFIWQTGADFDHGTGHGVGSYLSVHEGPQRISKLGTVPLQPGMILSNEPGYYREGHFGIRIENLVVVETREIDGAEREMFGFETLTFTPVDRRLIVRSLLTREERAWLDAYHARVLKLVRPHLSAPERAWLKEACRPL